MQNPETNAPELAEASRTKLADKFDAEAGPFAEVIEDLGLSWIRFMVEGIYKENDFCTTMLLKEFKPLILQELMKWQTERGTNYPMEDLYQQAVMEIIIRLRRHQLENPKALGKYLVKAVKISYHNYRRKASPYLNHETPVDFSDTDADPANSALVEASSLKSELCLDAGEQAVNAMLAQDIRKALHPNPDVQIILEKLLLDGSNAQQIADELHYTRQYVNQVKKRYLPSLADKFARKGLLPQIFAD